MLGLLKKIFDHNERQLKKLRPTVSAVGDMEDKMRQLSDEQLRRQTDRFRDELQQGAQLDDLLVPAFATVREAARRTLGERPYDVQVMGGIVLHQGRICEMKTGEGKTLAATMPAYLNALTRRGVHVVTVNDYLASRDAEWMGKIYEFLGLDVGLITSGMSPQERKKSYNCDITYGTNNEFGFDYLRDNMSVSPDSLVQRELHFAIVDEVDSVLIDEARTPLIISGSPTKVADKYYQFADVVKTLRREEHYTVEEKSETVAPTEEGIAEVEKRLGIDNLFSPSNIDLNYFFVRALKAKELKRRNEDYVVRDGEVVIVDQFTGRMMPGRRFGDGLHQALEAKEGVSIREETQTLATISYQNYFRMYDRLSGMTGTAATEADEFHEIYDSDVVVIPTNDPMIRDDLPDAVYRTREAKLRAVADDIENRHEKGQPVLVGTSSIEKSEELSRRLDDRGIPHEVLNAKHHEREAEIVQHAGKKNRVTIATNMAGRGTDIKLGQGVVELGGLHVLGTERHESRRIDNQLRGRSGRQGDPGSSQFFVSLEDDLLRLFGGDSLDSMFERLGVEDEERLEHDLLSRAIENAQRKVESRNFSARKRLLEYDDVLNEQRKVIYQQRRRVLHGKDQRREIIQMMEDLIQERVEGYCSEGRYPESWDLEGLLMDLQLNLLPSGRISPEQLLEIAEEEGKQGLTDHVQEVGRAVYRTREDRLGRDDMGKLERRVLLHVVDKKWVSYLAAVDDLRRGISLRSYGQQDPLVEYKKETHRMFGDMVSSIREDVIRHLFKMQLSAEDSTQQTTAALLQGQPKLSFQQPTPRTMASAEQKQQDKSKQSSGKAGPRQRQPYRRKKPKIGRNDPCPCGSGKKYKYCCGG